MPPRNTKPLPGTMPNGQNKEIYTRLCHEFIEDNYKRLWKYTLFRTRGNEDWAHELLHETLTILLEGWDNVDFTHSPYAYFQIMIQRQQARHKQVRKMEFTYKNIFPVDPLDPIFTNYIEEHKEESDMTFILDNFEALLGVLNKTERQHLEWFLDDMSYKEMMNHHPVSKTRIGQILTSARKKLKMQVEVLLQGDSVNDPGQ